MNIRDLAASLPYLFEAELTLFVWGDAGKGKSSVVRQYAEKKGYKFFPFYLGTQSDIGDVLGLAEFVENEDGSKSTAFAKPKWLNDMIEYCEQNPESGAVIFLDEFNRARRDILSGMFSLALDKTFHTIRLPKNCHVIAAGNPPTDGYFVTDVNETALMARFVHVKLDPTFDEWLEYAKAKEFDYTLVEFYKSQPALLEDARPEFKLPVKVDRRSVERLDKLFKIKTPQYLLEQLMPGIIGLERTVAYIQYLKESDKPLSAEEVFLGKKKSLLKKWNKDGDVLGSLLNLTCDNVAEEIAKRNKASSLLSKEEKKGLVDFLELIPKDISYGLMLKLSTPFVASNPAWKDVVLDKSYEERIKHLIRDARGKINNDETKK